MPVILRHYGIRRAVGVFFQSSVIDISIQTGYDNKKIRKL